MTLFEVKIERRKSFAFLSLKYKNKGYFMNMKTQIIEMNMNYMRQNCMQHSPP